MKLLKRLFIAVFIALPIFGWGQQINLPEDLGTISGNVQVLFQQYNEDSAIGAVTPPEQATMNAFTNLIYRRGKFSAGIRYESYLPRQAGYPNRFAGTGLGYRYASFTQENLSVTVGNFYEQFGNGLVLRSYEERNLGLDNAMDGVKVSFSPLPGIYLKGVYGKMRYNFNDGLINTDGYVRGIDGEIFVNQLKESWLSAKTQFILGGSFVSKYQRDNRSDLVLPENVGSWAGRMTVQRGPISVMGEYAYKINDPSQDNGYIYKDGRALLMNLTYATRGFSFTFDAKSIDNFSFRPDRSLQITDATINFLPAMTRQHSYILAGTFYPYATQFNGEVAFMAETAFKIPRSDAKWNKYGMDIIVSYAQAYNPDTTHLAAADDSQLNGYKTNNFLSPGDQLNYSDFHIVLDKKWSKMWKTKFSYFNFVYNNNVNQGAYFLDGSSVKGNVYADVFIAEINTKLKKKHNLRSVFQYMRTDQHQGDWIAAVFEYSVSPHWIFALLNQYNLGNPDEDNKLHYPFGSVTYVNGGNRFSVEYGKRRAGIFCVGGVCRPVPASNGLTLTVTSSF
jgi:hypothetical protein